MKWCVNLVAALAMSTSVASAQVALSGSAKNKPKTMPAIPKLSYSQPQPVKVIRAGNGRWDVRSITTSFGGRNVTAPILHLRGLDGIEHAQGLPDGVRRLLEMHVRTLRPGEPNHYMVNTQLAADWAKTHTVPANIKPADGDGHTGCNDYTWHCAGEVVAHAENEVEKLIQKATDAWNHATGQLSNEWNVLPECFADHTLPALDIPVQFSINPSMSVPLETSGSKDLGGGGSASGTVKGTVGLGFPMQSDFKTTLEVFYIPCLPFAVRPRSIGGSGTLTVGEQVKASVTATGKFDKLFTIPPMGGPQIPIEVIPIMVGEAPIAELDISAYIEGTVEVGGQGNAEGHFQLTNPHKAQFQFACSGAGCTGTPQSIADPTTTTEGAQLQGQVFVKPAVFTALQVDLDVDALSARAGPQPFLLGSAAGCGAVSASQTAGGPSTSSTNYALLADLDWGVELRAEALIARKIVGQKYVHSVTGNKHLWFDDVAPGGSSALDAAVTGPTQVGATKIATYKVKMPSCYPYPQAVTYQVKWTGNASAAAIPACKWVTGGGSCIADPTKDLVLNVTWPTPGSYQVSVVAVGDAHHRVFTPPPTPTQVSVTVTPSGGTP